MIFEIWECRECTFRFTQNIPGTDDMGAYYQSDNYISHTDTRKGFINMLYHRVRKRTLLGKLDLIRRYTGIQTGHLLDIGAGTGAFLYTMQQAGWKVSGIEPDAGSRTRALDNYNIALQSPEKLYETTGESVDVITLWHVLEHVHDIHGYMAAIKKTLKPGGTLIIAVPNYTCYDSRIYGKYWAAYDVPRHLWHFSPFSMKKLLNRHGLKTDLIKPMWYDSFYVSMLSEQYKTGRPAFIPGIFNGLLSNIKTIFNSEKCSSLIYIIKK